jgi:hypothetical protein
MLKKESWTRFQRIIKFFAQKFVTNLSKIWLWDPGSGKNLFRILDPCPGDKKAPDPGSATLVKNNVKKDYKGGKSDRLTKDACPV